MEYNGEAITKVRARELYNDADQKVLNTAFINGEIIQYKQLEIMNLLGKTIRGLQFKEM